MPALSAGLFSISLGLMVLVHVAACGRVPVDPPKCPVLGRGGAPGRGRRRLLDTLLPITEQPGRSPLGGLEAPAGHGRLTPPSPPATWL